LKTCACGCGKLLSITKRNKNKPPTYLRGHSNHLIVRKKGDPVKSFWMRVDKSESCWEWDGYIYPNGYGSHKVQGVTTYAHRYSWVIHFGPIPENMCVCHKCDNRKCVNPSHLFLGTHQDNMRDMDEKDRRTLPKGQKISVEQAKRIKELGIQGVHFNEIAYTYGLKRCTVANIVAGRIWKRLSHGY
jgi:hypothetical protein